MKQVVIISGKGGTGKTVITGALASLAENKVMADCDVDAADLHLLLAPDIKERHQFKGGLTAVIDADKCTGCGKCKEICRFDAISEREDSKTGEIKFEVDPISCEGCSFCKFVCPEGAIEMEESLAGDWFISDTRFGPLVHAKLGIAEENSGKLVSLVREQAKGLAEKGRYDWVIIDGTPGIGCPVIAALTGVDCAVIVTEPTLSGLHDADRVISVAKHFGILTKLVVNKYDLNIDMTNKIERYCADNNIDLAGRVHFNKSIVEAMVRGKTIMEYSDAEAKKEISSIWERIQKRLA